MQTNNGDPVTPGLALSLFRQVYPPSVCISTLDDEETDGEIGEHVWRIPHVCSLECHVGADVETVWDASDCILPHMLRYPAIMHATESKSLAPFRPVNLIDAVKIILNGPP